MNIKEIAMVIGTELKLVGRDLWRGYTDQTLNMYRCMADGNLPEDQLESYRQKELEKLTLRHLMQPSYDMSGEPFPAALGRRDEMRLLKEAEYNNLILLFRARSWLSDHNLEQRMK